MAKVKTEKQLESKIETIIDPKFQIRDIELISFSLTGNYRSNLEKVNFDVRIVQQIQKKEKFVVVTMVINVKDSENILGNIILRCTFEVENIASIVGHQPSLQDLKIKLNTITIGTARGVLYSVFKGTFLHGAILPIVDAQTFQESNLEHN